MLFIDRSVVFQGLNFYKQRSFFRLPVLRFSIIFMRPSSTVSPALLRVCIVAAILFACANFGYGRDRERFFSFADTTIINAYTPVYQYDDCNNQLIVRDGNEFKAGDTVLLIQMKGAAITESNTSTFGTITNMGSAGVYEFNYVKAVNGNRIELLFEIARAYNYPDGKVQLVRVPFYENLSTTSVLTALPWDGEIGGVLAFNVNGALTLNHDIDVSARGFRGGEAISNPNFVCNYTDFVTPITNGSVAARKGEGVYNTTALLNGRGKLANGGGGGNSTNSGGAGGGNGGRGGTGGNQFVGCGSTNFVNGGIGGEALSYSNAENRIFMGGGGGAGHQNDQPALGSGGNGGGIVIIGTNSFQSNGFQIISEGGTPPHSTGTNDDGRSGGGAGGTILLKFNTSIGDITGSVKGGNGDFCTPPGGDPHGPGGGGGGGIVWISQSSVPAAVNFIISGGVNGTNTNLGNNSLGSTPGLTGMVLTGLQLPFAQAPFQPNIDSVRFNYLQTTCTEVDFAGFAFTNTLPIVSWFWDFGDGQTDNSQDPSHLFSTLGTYEVKLVVTDAAGCSDSVSRTLTIEKLTAAFTFSQNACAPGTVSFNGNGLPGDSYWDFGDGTILTGQSSPTHQFAEGDFLVTFINNLSGCVDTIQRVVSATLQNADIILTPDTSICYGAEKMIRALAANDFCWSPTFFLSNSNTNTPTTSTPNDIRYYYTAQIEGTNLLMNPNFESGNTGFGSDYQHSSPTGVASGVYSVASNPASWNPEYSACVDHSSGAGNMLMVNGATLPGLVVWRQTVSVSPGKQYLFTSFIQKLTAMSFPGLKLVANGEEIPLDGIVADNTCVWTQLQTQWYSGTNTTVLLELVSKVDWSQGNDFAIDDLRFSEIGYYRDSVLISVERPSIQANADSTVCLGATVQLQATGAASYQWLPSAVLSNPNIANPTAILQTSTQFVVEGVSANGCTAKDTVQIDVFAVPPISVSNDTSICKNGSVQIWASGGDSYLWSPSADINDPNSATPVVSPGNDTRYFVTITDQNSCQFLDSVWVAIRPDPSFSVSGPAQICVGDSIQLVASGGDLFSWTPAQNISAVDVSSPLVWPAVTSSFEVVITESICNQSATLNTLITVLDRPNVTATRSNDIDCSATFSNLLAVGASQYVWSPSGSLDNPNIRNPRAQPTATTIYTVRGTDANGCSGTDTVQVKVDLSNLSSFPMPNAFTPNADGLNDCFGVKYWGAVNRIEFSIYNRWGERVFYSTDPNACWDGRYKGAPQDAGVFVYMVRASTACADNVFRKGTFVLVR